MFNFLENLYLTQPFGYYRRRDSFNFINYGVKFITV